MWDGTVPVSYTHLFQSIIKSGKKTLGRKTSHMNDEWFDGECKQIVIQVIQELECCRERQKQLMNIELNEE